jgi:fumarylacetoacetase
MLDATHDIAARSWVAFADGHAEFPLQNLPLGIVAPHGEVPRAGVAIGESVLDLPALLRAGLLSGAAAAAVEAAPGDTLNAMLELGGGPRRALRAQLFALLSAGAPEAAQVAGLLHKASDCKVLLPARIGDYTDFYAGLQHATNVGRQLRPDHPLGSNYKHVPLAYHGRASSVRPSGAPVRRPHGQRKPARDETPSFGPSRNLDYELEMGVWIGGAANALGESVPIAQAASRIAGFCLLNDWSARDIQAWEYQPLGPFLAKSFITTISPWIVTPEALAPFRMPQPARPDGDAAPMAYLTDAADQQTGALDVTLEVLLRTEEMRNSGLPPHRLSIASTTALYWTVAQMVTHHASGGCDLRPGDLFGTGTISASGSDGYGSLLEITEGGRRPLTLPSGETRRFLLDGDEITLRGRAMRDGAAPIGFGPCVGTVLPAA